MEDIYKSDFATFDTTKGESLLMVTLNSIDPTIEQVNEYFDLQDQITPFYEKKFVTIFDSRKAKWINSKARIQIGKRTAISQQNMKDRNTKIYIVLSNPVLKMIVKGINLVAKPVIPQVICTKMDEAMKLAQKEIATF